MVMSNYTHSAVCKGNRTAPRKYLVVILLLVILGTHSVTWTVAVQGGGKGLPPQHNSKVNTTGQHNQPSASDIEAEATSILAAGRQAELILLQITKDM